MNEPVPSPPTFEQSLADLERIVRQLEDGQVDLETALTHYEQGVGLLKRCYGQLSLAEQRILQLSGIDAEGRPVVEPFAHTATGGVARRRKKPSEAEAPVKSADGLFPETGERGASAP